MQKTTQESITTYMLAEEINQELTHSQHDRIDVMLLRVRILPQWQTKRQPHLTSILSHQVAKKERNMPNRDRNMTSPSQNVSKEMVKDSKT
jgi:hypothetical protein